MSDQQKEAAASGTTSEVQQEGVKVETQGEVPQTQAAPKPSVEEMIEKTQNELRELKILNARQAEELGVLRKSFSPAVQQSPVSQYPQSIPAPISQSHTKYDDMFYEDPNKPFLAVKQEAAREGADLAWGRFQNFIQQKEYVDNFYRANKDLDNEAGRTIVDAIASRYSNDLVHLTPDERAKHVAMKARELVMQVARPSTSGSQILSNRTPMVEGSGAIPTVTSQDQPKKLPTMVEQLKKYSKTY